MRTPYSPMAAIGSANARTRPAAPHGNRRALAGVARRSALKRDPDPLLDDDKAAVRLSAAAGIPRLSAIAEKQTRKKQ